MSQSDAHFGFDHPLLARPKCRAPRKNLSTPDYYYYYYYYTFIIIIIIIIIIIGRFFWRPLVIQEF